MGEWRYSSKILDLGTKWRWVDSFMAWLIYLKGKILLYLLDIRLIGPQSWSRHWRRKNSLPPAGNQILAIQPVAYCYTN
jgi:hypothetical protein